MNKYRIFSVWLLVLLAVVGWFLVTSERPGSSMSYPFKYGLDLNGGTELTYRADVSKLGPAEVAPSMQTLRDVIERRVNAFGVSEAVVQIEEAGVLSGNREYRLIVELPGVTDTERAIGIIGATPNLEFKLEVPGNGTTTPPTYAPTGVTGRLLERSNLEFRQVGAGAAVPNQPIVTLKFNEEGTALFAKVTKENVGKALAIFLDGELISSPVIREEIPDGTAQISGNFGAEEGRTLVRNLNYGALPVPIELASTQVIGASLGAEAKDLGVRAGIFGFLFVALFLILWYRLPGFTATIALLMYVALPLAVFKLFGVTLTAAGIAGFIISVGMAIDANVLIFERMKDELRAGKTIKEAVDEGFSRAWLPVRDASLSGIITAVILFWLGNAAVKGFALTLGIGNVASMFTAVTVVRTFLFALAGAEGGEGRVKKSLFGGKLDNA